MDSVPTGSGGGVVALHDVIDRSLRGHALVVAVHQAVECPAFVGNAHSPLSELVGELVAVGIIPPLTEQLRLEAVVGGDRGDGLHGVSVSDLSTIEPRREPNEPACATGRTVPTVPRWGSLAVLE